MIHPTPSELLARIADALTDTVLPELDASVPFRHGAGEARIQLQVAVLILRRLAGPAGDLGPYLDTDTRDVAATIDGWLTRIPLPAVDGAAAQDLVGEVLASEPVPALAELIARYEAVQALLVDVQLAVRELPPEHPDRVAIDAELRELLTRMVGRDSEIHTTYAAW
jgi:hypothetical protein